MERKEMLKKLGACVTALSIITGSSSLLSGCKKDENAINNSENIHYYVVFNGNNAIVYNDSVFIVKYDFKDRIVIYDGAKSITITDYIAFDNYTKGEVEEKVKDLIGEDGTIIYYETENKALKKTR